LCQNEQCY